MKDKSSSTNSKNREEKGSVFKKEYNPNFIIKNYSLKSSFNELKETKIIEVKIIASKMNIFEHFHPASFPIPEYISQINKLKKKYKDCPLKSMEEISKNKEPLSIKKPKIEKDIIEPNMSLEFLYAYIVSQRKNWLNMLMNNKSKNNIIYQKNDNKREQIVNFFDKNNNFLNHKRKRNESSQNDSPIDTSENNKNMEEEEEEKDKGDKKIIFHLQKNERGKKNFKKYKDFNSDKIKKNPGRKKKDSGEVGEHNKFSKDNMMRKLKNKVMESARKLINKLIKNESNVEPRNFREIRKIEGIYSQELNIKFNFWFYFQKLKDIFQFKMSSKYSKGDLNSNNKLINKIYSDEKRNKFPKTISLLEMPYYQFYHDIFLGEKKNWYLNFGINEEENKFELEYFLNIDISKNDMDYSQYKIAFYNLARNYEFFYLKKNPRLSGNKKTEEKESHSKQIIKYLSDEEIEAYKSLFIEKSIFYNQKMKDDPSKVLIEHKSLFKKIYSPNLKMDFIINKDNKEDEKEDKNEENKSDCVFNEETGNNINLVKVEKNSENAKNNKNKSENVDNVKNSYLSEVQINNSLKHYIFYITKKSSLNLTKKDIDNNNKEQVNSNLGSNNKINEQIFNSPTISKKNRNNMLAYKNLNINNIYCNTIDRTANKIEKEIQTDNNLIHDDSSQNLEIML